MHRAALIVVTACLLVAAGCKSGEPAALEPVPAPVADDGIAWDSPAGYEPGPAAIEAAPVAEPAAAPEPIVVAPVSQSYTIRKGDTLYKIALRHFGDGKRWQEIASANGITDPTKLAVGQVITLP